ncbi:MAG: RluA family pseudouridine synthase [Planctomycetota bacterium]
MSPPPPVPDASDAPTTVVLPPDVAGLRLDKALAERFPEHSRTVVAGWIEAGLVTVDGRALAGKTKLKGGETVEVRVPPPAPSELVPEDRPLAVLHEDDALLVLDKPSGLTVHPGSGQKDGTLANALVFHLQHLPTVGGSDRPGIVHRLDKDTSGVMLIAKTEAAHRALSRAFAAREVHKEYLAVLHGAMEGEKGRIDLPLGRSSAGRTRMAVRMEGGRAAVTDWAVEERLPRHTLVRCFPVTGRTHQLRVHFRSQEHPIVGDPLYGWKSSPGEDVVTRLLLHAHRISLAHPVTGAPLTFQAEPPAAFVAALVALRRLEGGGRVRR